jgi:hypothetical protein
MYLLIQYVVSQLFKNLKVAPIWIVKARSVGQLEGISRGDNLLDRDLCNFRDRPWFGTHVNAGGVYKLPEVRHKHFED